MGPTMSTPDPHPDQDHDQDDDFAGTGLQRQNPEISDSDQDQAGEDGSKFAVKTRTFGGFPLPNAKYLIPFMLVVVSCCLASYFGLQCTTNASGDLVCGFGARDRHRIEEERRGWVKENRKVFEKEQRKWLDWMVKEGIEIDVEWERLEEPEKLYEFGGDMADYGCEVAELGSKIKEHGIRLMKKGSRYAIDAAVLKRTAWHWREVLTSKSGATSWKCTNKGVCVETTPISNADDKSSSWFSWW